ncbi:MAG: hypothetical protein SWN10_24245, partial [Pseudomonadota bacterium]|nr:hypothetical protein [Pseudomonadota bacterium]
MAAIKPIIDVAGIATPGGKCLRTSPTDFCPRILLVWLTPGVTGQGGAVLAFEGIVIFFAHIAPV